jgi:hypothetical protein
MMGYCGGNDIRADSSCHNMRMLCWEEDYRGMTAVVVVEGATRV